MRALTDEELARVMELLDAREGRLLSMMTSHVAQLRESSAPDAEATGDTADLAGIESVREQENSAIKRDTDELKDIGEARERLSTEEAGVCTDCGDPIGFERLLALPTALRCLSCQDRYERVHELIGVPEAKNG